LFERKVAAKEAKKLAVLSLSSAENYGESGSPHEFSLAYSQKLCGTAPLISK
jgi:hypothetical protein